MKLPVYLYPNISTVILDLDPDVLGVNRVMYQHDLKIQKGIKNKGISDMKALYDFIKENHPNVAKEYGMSSLTEFASELMSNRDFQQTLAQIPYRVEHQSLFTAFIRAVLNALGLSPTQKLSALARGLMAAEQSMALGRKIQEDVVTGKETMPLVKNTDAFKRWFKDSKVVDENGEPLLFTTSYEVDTYKEQNNITCATWSDQVKRDKNGKLVINNSFK